MLNRPGSWSEGNREFAEVPRLNAEAGEPSEEVLNWSSEEGFMTMSTSVERSQ